jgi:uncharacterized protein
MIKRSIFNRLCEELHRPEINILLGPRQVGKTTLLHALQAHAEQQGIATVLYDLEQPDVLAAFNQPDQAIIEKLATGPRLVFMDEFHYLHNASKIFKAIFDRQQGIKLVCSGSSALAMHQHLKESLAGRRLLFHIYPLQLHEMRAARPQAAWTRYAQYGGMPALTHTEDDTRQQELLAELLSAYILKDIKALVREENIRTFNHLLYLLAERQGSTMAVHSLAREVGLSSKTVNRYLDILEGTFVNFRIWSYSQNLGNELKKSCKTYLYDVGIRNALLKDFAPLTARRDKGVLLESCVFLRLRSALAPNQDITFWRTKDADEVDFVLLTNRQPLPIEVKSQHPAGSIPKGLRRFVRRYPATRHALVVNDAWEGTVQQDHCTVRFLTFETFDREAPWRVHA